MKRTILLLSLLATSLVALCWGAKGHHVVALIAEKHLLPKTRDALHYYLAGESIEDAATWPDEHRTSEDARWHFINLPLGLSSSQFEKAVKESNATVYTALLQSEATLRDKSATATEKQRALRFLIHLVGDAHQPMHVSRAEDKGGNTIQVRFDGEGTNLHSLWDSRLINREGYNEAEMVAKYDVATAEQETKWQKDEIIQWLWESYQLSSELYKQTEPGQTISDAYYTKYIPVIHQRIDQAGIRLAGELNKLLADATVLVAGAKEVKESGDAGYVKANLRDIAGAVGKTVVVTGKVFGTKDIGSLLLVNVGDSYPNNPLTVALKGAAKAAVSNLEGKTVTAQGEVISYKGKPEIIITNIADLQVQ